MFVGVPGNADERVGMINNRHNRREVGMTQRRLARLAAGPSVARFGDGHWPRTARTAEQMRARLKEPPQTDDLTHPAGVRRAGRLQSAS